MVSDLFQKLHLLIHTRRNYSIVCSYYITYGFLSESRLYSCLNVNEILPQNRHDIWSSSDSNGIRTHNHLVRKWTLNDWNWRDCGFMSRCSHNYFSFIWSFEPGNSGKEGKKLQNIDYFENERSFLEEIKNIFGNFWNIFEIFDKV